MSLLAETQNPAELGDRLRDAYVVTAEFLSDIITPDLPPLSIRWPKQPRPRASSG